MYHCQIHFYFAGHPCRAFDIIKEMPPLVPFTHDFCESDEPEEALAARGDVIIASLQGMDAKEALKKLISGKRKEAEIILLAEKEQIAVLTDELPEIKDIWVLPLSDEEIRFRFQRFDRNCHLLSRECRPWSYTR